MRTESLESVKNKILTRQDRWREKWTQQFKHDRPLAKEKIPANTIIWALDNLGTLDMQQLRQENGDEAVNIMLYLIDKMRTDGRRKK